MKYRTFGRLSWQVSEIGFGAWAIGGSWGSQSDDDSVKALRKAIELGCNFIDTAQAYGDGRSERVISQVLADYTGHEIYVATKIPPTSDGEWPPTPYDSIEKRYPEQYLRDRVDRSLRDLRTDVLDVVQLHTWTRAWNANPVALQVLQSLKKEGKIRGIGISTPEHDQNSLISLMRDGWLDAVQVIYNIFDQEPQAEFFPAAAEANVGVIVRVALDESALTGKLTPATKWEEGDFRNRYFAGDRLERVVKRVESIRPLIEGKERDLATAALKFALKPTAVSTVIPGIRNVHQAELNVGVSDLPAMSDAMEHSLRKYNWRRGIWYSGK